MESENFGWNASVNLWIIGYELCTGIAFCQDSCCELSLCSGNRYFHQQLTVKDYVCLGNQFNGSVSKGLFSVQIVVGGPRDYLSE